jgi:hypothetical protein
MTTPVYDCKEPNCWACHHRFRTREGLTSIVVEEARAVVEAERDLDQLIGKNFEETGDDEGDDAVIEAHNKNVQEAEQDMIAMVIRLANAIGQLDAFTANPATPK